MENRAGGRRADRTGTRYRQIRRIQNRSSRRPLDLYGSGRRHDGAGPQRLHADARRAQDSSRIRPDPDSRHAGRGRTPARISGHDENPVLVLRLRHIGHHVRQGGLQTRPARSGSEHGPRDSARPSQSGRSRRGDRPAGPAAVRQAERQRKQLRRHESQNAGTAASRRRGRVRRERPRADGGDAKSAAAS